MRLLSGQPSRNPLAGNAKYKEVGNGNEDGNGNGNHSSGSGQGNQSHGGDSSGNGGLGHGGTGGSLPSGSGGSGDGGSDRGWSQGSGCNGSARQDKTDQKQGNNPGEEGTDVDMNMGIEQDQHDMNYHSGLETYIVRGKSPRVYHDQLRARTLAQAPWDPSYSTRPLSSGSDAGSSSSYSGQASANSDSTVSASRTKGNQGTTTKCKKIL